MTTSAPSVFVSGAGSGIGRATALGFAKKGYRVGAYDIATDGLLSLHDEILAAGGTPVTGRLDVTDADSWASALAEFVGASHRLDILVNNAGVLAAGPFETMSVDDHVRMIDVNVRGVVLGARAAFPYLSGTRGAQLVNLCSASAIYGQPELATYSATKFAVRSLTESLELEWRRHDIRVFDVWPLFVSTAMVDGVSTGSTRALGVRLTAQDVADRIVGLATTQKHPRGKVHFPIGTQTRVLAVLAQFSGLRLNRLTNRLFSSR